MTFLIGRMFKSPSQKIVIDRVLLAIPKVKDVIVRLELARLSRTLALLLKSGMPVLNAIKVAVPVLSNEVIKKDLEASYQILQGGGLLSEGFKRSRYFPHFVSQLVSVGEESGNLEDAFREIAEWYEQEMDQIVKFLMNLMEPAIILFIGGILGLFIMAILLPVFSLNALNQ